MSAPADVGYHARQHARWHWGEIAFWIAALACAFVFPSRYLIMTDIVRLALFCAVARPNPRLCRHRFAWTCRVLRRRRLLRRTVGPAQHRHRTGDCAGCRGSCRHGARLSHELPRDPRCRPDPADGDPRHCAPLEALAERFSDITGGTDGLQGIEMQPILGLFALRHVRQNRVLLFARRAVPVVPAGAPDRALAIRPVAAGDPQQPAAGGGDRHSRQQAADRGLYAGRILRGHCGRAVHPDHGACLARPYLRSSVPPI